MYHISTPSHGYAMLNAFKMYLNHFFSFVEWHILSIVNCEWSRNLRITIKIDRNVLVCKLDDDSIVIVVALIFLCNKWKSCKEFNTPYTFVIYVLWFYPLKIDHKFTSRVSCVHRTLHQQLQFLLFVYESMLYGCVCVCVDDDDGSTAFESTHTVSYLS